jgi:leucine dehydrogenase
MAREGFEELIALQDRRSGLRAFLGIHDTSRGPAFGGIRRYPYRDERTALVDCLRLAKAMSLKCALADVPGGGAKMVILDHGQLDEEAAYRHVGQAIERLDGRYYAGPDVGTSWRHLGWVSEHTSYATRPGDEGPGDLAGATATGVFAGMAAALTHLDGAEDWDRRTVVVQGLGEVGWSLARRLRGLGTRVLAVELDEEVLDRAHTELGVEPLETGSELDVECDVFCPCAMGGLLHDLSVQRLGARIVCGAANNPLARSRHAERLHARGVLYMPDFVVNAGAVISGATYHLEGRPVPQDEIEVRIGRIAADVLHMAREQERSPFAVARREAEGRIRAARRVRDDAEELPARPRRPMEDGERVSAVTE